MFVKEKEGKNIRKRKKAEKRKEENERIGDNIDKKFEIWEIFYNPRK